MNNLIDELIYEVPIDDYYMNAYVAINMMNI